MLKWWLVRFLSHAVPRGSVAYPLPHCNSIPKDGVEGKKEGTTTAEEDSEYIEEEEGTATGKTPMKTFLTSHPRALRVSLLNLQLQTLTSAFALSVL